jgi:hypothetical protein
MSARIVIACALLVGACARGGELRVVPTRGAIEGGDRLRIEGDDFLGHGPVTIHVGEKPARAVVIESPWLITITTPAAEEAGVVPLRIEFADGRLAEIPDAYTYEERENVGIIAPKRSGG